MKCHLCNQQIDETQIWWMKDGLASHDVCPKPPDMKTKHTATPWRLAPDGATIHCGSEHDPEIVCSCDINDPMALEIDDQEANAQFITLACNHFEELVEALETIQSITQTTVDLVSDGMMDATEPGRQLMQINTLAKSLLTKLKG